MIDTIKDLWREIYNLQVSQKRSRQSKPVTPVEPLQEIRNQIMPYRERGGFRERGQGRGRGGYTWSKQAEC